MKLKYVGSADAESYGQLGINRVSPLLVREKALYTMCLLCEIGRSDLCHCVDWRVATSVSEGLAASIFRVVRSS